MSLLALTTATLAAPSGFPGPSIDYAPLAFFPERWQEKKISSTMVPWTGERVVFLTTTNALDKDVMQLFVKKLDSGWSLYRDLVGVNPKPLKIWENKPVIAAIPTADLTCGYGCGYVGLTGIEVAGFYSDDYPLLRKDRAAFPHYYFYEMGRNYYVFKDRHSLFITGFAVFMRYVCMDTLECRDPDLPTRRVIEQCEELYAQSDIPFMDAFTNLGNGEKAHRLKDQNGNEVSPSDQPCMYASVMLKLRKEHGGDKWVRRFCEQLNTCPEFDPGNPATAKKQLLNWLIASSVAAAKDLSPVFCDRWRMPIHEGVRAKLKTVDWEKPGLTAPNVLAMVQAEQN